MESIELARFIQDRLSKLHKDYFIIKQLIQDDKVTIGVGVTDDYSRVYEYELKEKEVHRKIKSSAINMEDINYLEKFFQDIRKLIFNKDYIPGQLSLFDTNDLEIDEQDIEDITVIEELVEEPKEVIDEATTISVNPESYNKIMGIEPETEIVQDEIDIVAEAPTVEVEVIEAEDENTQVQQLDADELIASVEIEQKEPNAFGKTNILEF